MTDTDSDGLRETMARAARTGDVEYCLKHGPPSSHEEDAAWALTIADAILALLPDQTGQGPGGWLIKDYADGWFWTGHRIAAVAALTEGHSVFDLTRQAYAPPARLAHSPSDRRVG